jgi:hypothetical protein
MHHAVTPHACREVNLTILHIHILGEVLPKTKPCTASLPRWLAPYGFTQGGAPHSSSRAKFLKAYLAALIHFPPPFHYICLYIKRMQNSCSHPDCRSVTASSSSTQAAVSRSSVHRVQMMIRSAMQLMPWHLQQLHKHLTLSSYAGSC